LIIILDKRQMVAMERLEPHLGVMDVKKPRTVSNNIGLPSPPLTTMVNWLHG
jgi:hypothetical protein